MAWGSAGFAVLEDYVSQVQNMTLKRIDHGFFQLESTLRVLDHYYFSKQENYILYKNLKDLLEAVQKWKRNILENNGHKKASPHHNMLLRRATQYLEFESNFILNLPIEQIRLLEPDSVISLNELRYFVGLEHETMDMPFGKDAVIVESWF